MNSRFWGTNSAPISIFIIYWNIYGSQPRGAAPLTIGRSAQCHPLVVGGAALCGGVSAAPRGQNEALEMHLAPFWDQISVLVFKRDVPFNGGTLLEFDYLVYFWSNIIECLDTLSLKDSLSWAWGFSMTFKLFGMNWKLKVDLWIFAQVWVLYIH